MLRDSKMLTLLALKQTKALLIACKEVLDLPQGRILDAAVEEYAIAILGVRKVRQIQKAMRDPEKAALLIREPPTEDGAAAIIPDATTTPKPSRSKKSAKRSETKPSARISYLREPEPEK